MEFLTFRHTREFFVCRTFFLGRTSTTSKLLQLFGGPQSVRQPGPAISLPGAAFSRPPLRRKLPPSGSSAGHTVPAGSIVPRDHVRPRSVDRTEV